MQVSLTEGLRLRLGDTSLFLTIACEPLNIVCGQNLMILALELSNFWSPGGEPKLLQDLQATMPNIKC